MPWREASDDGATARNWSRHTTHPNDESKARLLLLSLGRARLCVPPAAMTGTPEEALAGGVVGRSRNVAAAAISNSGDVLSADVGSLSTIPPSGVSMRGRRPADGKCPRSVLA